MDMHSKGGIIRMENENTCHCCKKKDRSDRERKDLMNRLSRIEGQIRGIKGMVEKDCYCPDIITQVAAANAALNSRPYSCARYLNGNLSAKTIVLFFALSTADL